MTIGTRRSQFRSRMLSWLADEQGATAVEYGVMVALIAGVIIAIVLILGSQVRSMMCSPLSELLQGTDPVPGAADACD